MLLIRALDIFIEWLICGSKVCSVSVISGRSKVLLSTQELRKFSLRSTEKYTDK